MIVFISPNFIKLFIDSLMSQFSENRDKKRGKITPGYPALFLFSNGCRRSLSFPV